MLGRARLVHESVKVTVIFMLCLLYGDRVLLVVREKPSTKKSLADGRQAFGVFYTIAKESNGSQIMLQRDGAYFSFGFLSLSPNSRLNFRTLFRTTNWQ